MGLGLPMVASLIWEAGGGCRLANREDGPGVSVELTLPLHTPAVHRDDEIAPPRIISTRSARRSGDWEGAA